MDIVDGEGVLTAGEVDIYVPGTYTIVSTTRMMITLQSPLPAPCMWWIRPSVIVLNGDANYA